MKKGYRFIRVSQNDYAEINWVFMPGGPGLGSEYLAAYLEDLKLPGAIWRCDFPGDGSNVLQEPIDYSSWPETLPEALSTLDKVILVAHSFSGMITQAQPALERELYGLVLMSTTPRMKMGLIPGVLKRTANIDMSLSNQANVVYLGKDSDINFKHFIMAWFNDLSLNEYKHATHELLEPLPYKGHIFSWALREFNPNYASKWVPKNVQTLIVSGEKDLLTPVSLFEKKSDYIRDNIKIQSIDGAGHFPWIESFEGVQSTLLAFYNSLTKC